MNCWGSEVTVNYRYLLIIFLAVVIIAAAGVFWFFNIEFASQTGDFKKTVKTAHVYKDASKPIAVVLLKVFYVVPKNKSKEIKPAKFIQIGV